MESSENKNENIERENHDGAVTADEICTVHDVFLNESRAREFVGICNELGLSPVHIYDAVQDAIG